MSMQTLPSGRRVYHTGKVMVGILAQPQRQRDPGMHADLLQRVLCTPLPRRWYPTPRSFYLKPPLWQRLIDLLPRRADRGIS